MIEPGHPKLSVTRQCELLALPRASYYHRPVPESDENLHLMRVIDETYLAYPVFGSRQMASWLRRQGYNVNRKRVRRLMRLMGLEAIYRKPNLSRKHPANPIFRYLLRRLVIDRPNQVWAMDITYIPMAKGFVYLAAVMDWHTRRVLSWRVSISMDASFCVEAVEEALQRFGTPQIFNTDQGSQFTGKDFNDLLKKHDIRISMDGKGCWRDNVFVERLWRSVKYEEVYLHAYDSVSHARTSLDRYFQFYNSKRPHTALERKTPDQVYFKSLPLPKAA